MYRIWLHILLLLILGALWPIPAHAQFWPALSGRMVSRDGKWLGPVANPLLSSDEGDHLRRGSVNAWDLTVPLGTPVYPMASGKVSYAGCNNAGGYGCWVLIEHGEGYSSIYAHMLDEGGGTVWVKSGEPVTPWTVLGRVGWTGMTSFGPHVHWEIRHSQYGRLRNDRFFSRSAVEYCKFCAATDDQARGQSTQLTGMAYVANRLLSREAVIGLLIVALALLLFFRPDTAVVAAQHTSRLLYRLLGVTQGEENGRNGWRKRHLLYLTTIMVAPGLLCGSVTAFAVWMADQGVTPTALIAYWRYGVYPLIGGGYQSGAKYSAVWGMPCSGVGTLGQSCTVDEIVAAGIAWQQEITQLSGANPKPVVIPRLHGRFGLREARALLTAMHARDGLVIVDAGADFELAHQAVSELTEYGLDGVAIDLEYVKNARPQEIRTLAEALATARKDAKLRGEGVLVLWNVFHNLEPKDKLAVRGVKIVPIFTGYGSAASKVAGLQTTQKLFGTRPSDSGLMAFDRRWPVNNRCQSFDTRQGYDCQNWVTLFADPTAQQVGWWVQQ
jgi:murein DD-endopeptidase MepM/ murein hydrolase activator NlpD